jgi:hypothetical protein
MRWRAPITTTETFKEELTNDDASALPRIRGIEEPAVFLMFLPGMRDRERNLLG